MGVQFATEKKKKKIQDMRRTSVNLTRVIIEKNDQLCNCAAALLGCDEDDLMQGTFLGSVGWQEKKPSVFLTLVSVD